MAGFRGCPHRERAELVQKIRNKNQISYIEALRRIQGADNSNQAARQEREQMPPVTVPEDSIVIKKSQFLAFFL